jgi:nicotinate phosphoribosyltransferase
VNHLSAADLTLLTDLYELTMASAYLDEAKVGPASFELFVRELPPQRRFLVVAGTAEVARYLAELAATPEQVDYLRSTGRFPDAFCDWFADLSFDGDLWAIPEGEVAHAGEPLVRVTASLPVAQLVETYVINAVISQTLVASKAARVAIACGDRDFVDFSARRDHGPGAALQAARASWIAGAAGTSLVLAGQRWGLPLSGTMAHAYVMAHDDERDAFRSYARAFPDGAVLLLDTYDTVQGARHAVEVAHELAGDGIRIAAVRLDSGDLGVLARQVRGVLDDGGLGDVRIVASGDLDEHRIAQLVGDGAPVDAFGVGTQLGTSADAPALGGVYKLVEDEGGPRLKLSPGKATLPGRKQVWRTAVATWWPSTARTCPAAGRCSSRCSPAAGGWPTGPSRRSPTSTPPGPAARPPSAALPPAARRLEPREPDEVVWPVSLSAGLVELRDRLTAAREAAGEPAAAHRRLRGHVRPAPRRAPGDRRQRPPRPGPRRGAAGGGCPALAEAGHPGHHPGGGPLRHGGGGHRGGDRPRGQPDRDRPGRAVVLRGHARRPAGRRARTPSCSWSSAATPPPACPPGSGSTRCGPRPPWWSWTGRGPSPRRRCPAGAGCGSRCPASRSPAPTSGPA